LGTWHAPPRSRPSKPLSGAAKYPAGARPSKCYYYYYYREGFQLRIGSDRRIDRTVTRRQILDAGKREHVQKEEYRAIIEPMYDKAEEYDWKDQFTKHTNAPWKHGRRIEFSLRPWMKENSPGWLAKRRCPSGGAGGSAGVPFHASQPSVDGSSDATGSGNTSGRSTSAGYQSRTHSMTTRDV
jgi:hypothetical protein